MNVSGKGSHPSFGRIGIAGAGAMGSSLAIITSRLAPTVMVCRNPKRAGQIFDRGLRMTGAIEGEARPIIVRAVADLASVGGVDVLFIATKTTAIPALCEELRPVLDRIATGSEGAYIVSYQNGVDPGREIMERLGYDRVLRMVLHYGAVLDHRTGLVNVAMFSPPHYIGCVREEHVPACRALAEGLTSAGFETQYDPDIERQVWTKSLLNAAMNPVAALVNLSVGEVLASPSRAVVERLLCEGIDVARAAGIALDEDFQERGMAAIARASDHLPSMVHDIRHGRESEVGQLNRQIIHRAKRLGVPVPTHDTIDRLIETFDWRVYQHRAAGLND